MLALLNDSNSLRTILVRDVHTPRFPESCTANFLSALLLRPNIVYCVDNNHATHIECHVSSDSHVVRNPYADPLAIVQSFVHIKKVKMARMAEYAKCHFASVAEYELNKQELVSSGWHLRVPMNLRESMMRLHRHYHL